MIFHDRMIKLLQINRTSQYFYLKWLWPAIILINMLYPQNLTKTDADCFIESLVSESEDLAGWFQKEELGVSERLGISYQDVNFKFLISQDIDPGLKRQLQLNPADCKYEIHAHPNGSVLQLHIGPGDICCNYYFFDGNLVSPPNFFGVSWQTQTSRFFHFHISNPAEFNDCNIRVLDGFVEKMLSVMEFSREEILKLEIEKIHYYLCEDIKEIKELTGYEARGMYYIPCDYIVSTFTCHYHEIMHLLMNYKLQTPQLYTLPFLQEGFAVACGGRGGKEPEVILSLGEFLSSSGFLSYRDLLNKKGFYMYDASMSYPLAGLYTKFLIETKGMEWFTRLYEKYSCGAAGFDELALDPALLPDDAEWHEYLGNRNDCPIIISSENIGEKHKVSQGPGYTVHESDDCYLFSLKNGLFLFPEQSLNNYNSKLFSELYPGKQYKKQKYLISACEDEISVYNFYTNNLVAKYTRGFTLNQEPVSRQEGYFNFAIRKDVLDGQMRDYKIIDMEENYE